jgi:hypothetical protein
MRRTVLLIAIVTALASACSASGMSSSDNTEDVNSGKTEEIASGNTEEVSRSDFGSNWPLTVESGTLACEGAGAVTFTTSGTTYAVNGMAQGMDQYAEIDPIWADEGGGLKKNIGPLIDRGLSLCA